MSCVLSLIALKQVQKWESISTQGDRVRKRVKKQCAIVILGTIDLHLLLMFIV